MRERSFLNDYLEDTGIELPEPAPPVANYVAANRTGNLIYISGQGPLEGGNYKYTGKVGSDLTIEEGYDAARIVGLNCLAVLKKEIGSLSKVSKIVKILGWVNSAPGFNQQPLVINGASDLFVNVFGDKGKHARSAVSANELPFDIPVEIEVIFEVND